MTTLDVADWGGPGEPFQLATRGPVYHQPGQSFINDELWKYAGGHLGFYGWLRVVNRCIGKVVGISLLDLPDPLWHDDYEGRVPPHEAADVAIDETAAELGIDSP